ncbi:hypothetical protein OV079_01365 [Nannocystis pusilla]|uniref:Uncharacterized protein n=1 Tax=Nannocystis pusilla TaxID=889268 RepID=A0A9X3EHL4_9BACT|nr:hypothetical protein [Nannocystis pusilla]MCY1004238.1 hypothetical protein [Nannocystis pusilla]
MTPTPSAPASEPAAAAGPLGTAEPRVRLFAEIWDKTARREAFSPVKNQRLALDVRGGMETFAATIVDNELGHTIGMPTGGFSNTREWSEVLRTPGTEGELAEALRRIDRFVRGL